MSERNRKDVKILTEESPDNSIFKPLCGQEERKWLEEKYGYLDFYEGETSTKTVVKDSKSPSKRKKYVCVDKTPSSSKFCVKMKTSCKESQIIISDDDPYSEEDKNIFQKKTSVKDDVIEISSEDNNEEELLHPEKDHMTVTSNDTSQEDGACSGCLGFDEEDFEKPKFRFTSPSAAKVAFMLSEPSDEKEVQVPAPMNQYLRDYQRDGIKFMYENFVKKNGAILGDDMGLGKTVQVIALLTALLGKKCDKTDVTKQKPKFIRQMSDFSESEDECKSRKPFLIIGPGSVLYNWMDEFETWGYFCVGKFHGSEKNDCLSKLRKKKLEVVLTTFETFRDNLDTLNSIDWEAIITDEVHRIKGLNSQTTQALRSIKTRMRFGLTGTALQNNMTELWSLLDWVRPGCLGSVQTFRQEFVIPIENGQKQDASKRELAHARKLKEKFAKIRNNILLRRTKQLIADQLPFKDDNVVFCKLTEFQIDVYKKILEHPGLVHVLTMDEPCSCGSGEPRKACCKETSEGESVNSLQFIFMHLLLKVSNHTALLIPDKKSQQCSFSKQVCKTVFQHFPGYFQSTKESSFRTLSDPKYCGKMKILQSLLKIFHKDHSKVLIFSYSTRVLSIMEQYLMTTGYEYRRLDGSTSISKRMVLVKEFNHDQNIFIFLISAKAGGLGLNLTGANRVIIFDPSWNPTNDLQAQDRAYRLGQRRNVQVYRLISAGTIEENMYLRQVYKQQLDSVAVESENARRYFSAIAGDKKRYGELFGIKNMFQLRTGDTCLTVDIVKKNENLEKSLMNFDIAKYIAAPSPVDENPEPDTETGNSCDDTSEDLNDYFSLKETFYGEQDSKFSFINENKGSKKGKETKTPIKKSQSRKTFSTTSLQEEESPDSLRSVFERNDVVHILKNKQVVGGSKAEDHMSKCAIQDVYELHQNSQEPAAYCQPYSDSSESDEYVTVKRKKANPIASMVIGNTKVFIGQTPKAIKQRQFEKMTESLKHQSLLDFAKTVIKSSSKQRRNMLKKYYTDLDPDLEQAFVEDQGSASVEKHQETRKHVRKQKQKRNNPNETLGGGFCEDSDSDNKKSSHHVLRTDSSSSENFRVGKTSTPKPRKQPKHLPAKVKLTPSHVKSTSKHAQAITGENCKNSYDVKNIVDEGFEEERTSDVTDLLDQMEQDTDDCTSSSVMPHLEVDAASRACDDKNKTLSFLDDLFDEDVIKVQRKPAPSSGDKRKQDPDGSDDLFSDSFSSQKEEAEVTNVIIDSTLKDDSIDCFSNISKFTKRHKAHNIVSRLVSESDSKFKELSETGKMVRKPERIVSIGSSLGEDIPSCDRTPSLF